MNQIRKIIKQIERNCYFFEIKDHSNDRITIIINTRYTRITNFFLPVSIGEFTIDTHKLKVIEIKPYNIPGVENRLIKEIAKDIVSLIRFSVRKNRNLSEKKIRDIFFKWIYELEKIESEYHKRLIDMKVRGGWHVRQNL